jgi:hypothetical protein
MGFFERKKLMFALVNAFMFLLIASPQVYRLVGGILSLEYDDENNNNRTSLLFLHSLVFGLVTLVTVNVMPH